MIEMDAVAVGVPWPKPRQRPPQPGREAVPHLCHRCLATLERHAGAGVSETYWCPGCGSASAKLTDLCACGITRAGVRLRCVTLANDAGDPGEIAVIEDTGTSKPAH